MKIKINNLEVTKNRFKLGPINHTFEPGYVYAITGNSGGGKTLFLQSILGSIDISKDMVEYDDKNFYDNEIEIKGSYSYVPDKILFSDRLTVENLIFKLKKFDDRFDSDICGALIKKYNIYRHLNIYELSKAQEKILLFAIGIATKSKVLVLDNPFSAVGLVARKEMLRLLREYMNDDKIIILVTEEPEVIQNLADYVLVFEQGKIVLNEDVIELQERYNNISVEEILLSILKGEKENV